MRVPYKGNLASAGRAAFTASVPAQTLTLIFKGKMNQPHPRLCRVCARMSSVVFRRIGIVHQPKGQELLELPVAVEQRCCEGASKERRVQVQQRCRNESIGGEPGGLGNTSERTE